MIEDQPKPASGDEERISANPPEEPITDSARAGGDRLKEVGGDRFTALEEAIAKLESTQPLSGDFPVVLEKLRQERDRLRTLRTSEGATQVAASVHEEPEASRKPHGALQRSEAGGDRLTAVEKAVVSLEQKSALTVNEKVGFENLRQERDRLRALHGSEENAAGVKAEAVSAFGSVDDNREPAPEKDAAQSRQARTRELTEAVGAASEKGDRLRADELFSQLQEERFQRAREVLSEQGRVTVELGSATDPARRVELLEREQELLAQRKELARFPDVPAFSRFAGERRGPNPGAEQAEPAAAPAPEAPAPVLGSAHAGSFSSEPRKEPEAVPMSAPPPVPSRESQGLPLRSPEPSVERTANPPRTPDRPVRPLQVREGATPEQRSTIAAWRDFRKRIEGLPLGELQRLHQEGEQFLPTVTDAEKARNAAYAVRIIEETMGKRIEPAAKEERPLSAPGERAGIAATPEKPAPETPRQATVSPSVAEKAAEPPTAPEQTKAAETAPVFAVGQKVAVPWSKHGEGEIIAIDAAKGTATIVQRTPGGTFTEVVDTKLLRTWEEDAQRAKEQPSDADRAREIRTVQAGEEARGEAVTAAGEASASPAEKPAEAVMPPGAPEAKGITEEKAAEERREMPPPPTAAEGEKAETVEKGTVERTPKPPEGTPGEKYSEAWLQQEFERFHISSQELEKLPHYADLSPGQKALLLENFKQTVIGRIETEAAERYQQKTAQAGKLGKIVQGVLMYYFKAGERKASFRELTEGGVATHGKVLATLAEGLFNNGPEVAIEGNNLTFQYVRERDFKKPLTDEDRETIRAFNDVANKLAFLSYESSLKTAKEGQRLDFEDTQQHYDAAREKLLHLYRSDGGDVEAMQSMNAVDWSVKMNQFLTEHPDAERELQRIESEKAWLSALKDTATERGALMVGGYLARTAVVGMLGFLGAPVVGAAVGAVGARMRGEAWLKEQDILARKGRERSAASQKVSRNIVTAAKEQRTVRKPVEVVVPSPKGPETITKNVEYTVEVIGLAEKLDHLVERIGRENDQARQARLLASLEVRLGYTTEKIQKGLVDFGRNPEERIYRQYALTQALARAEAYRIGLGARGDAKKHQEISERLNETLAATETKIAKGRKDYLNRQMKFGALCGAGFAAAGVIFRTLIEHPSWFGLEKAQEHGPAGVAPGDTAHAAAPDDTTVHVTPQLEGPSGAPEPVPFAESHPVLAQSGFHETTAAGHPALTLELGKGGAPQHLEQVFDRMAAESAHLGKEFGNVDASRILNVGANLRELSEGHDVAGVSAELFKRFATVEDGKLTIADFDGFQKAVLDPMTIHAEQAITPENVADTGAVAYVDNIRHATWSDMLAPKGVGSHDIRFDEAMIDRAEGRLMTSLVKASGIDASLVHDFHPVSEDDGTFTVFGETVWVHNGAVERIGDRLLDEPFTLGSHEGGQHLLSEAAREATDFDERALGPAQSFMPIEFKLPDYDVSFEAEKVLKEFGFWKGHGAQDWNFLKGQSLADFLGKKVESQAGTHGEYFMEHARREALQKFLGEAIAHGDIKSPDAGGPQTILDAFRDTLLHRVDAVLTMKHEAMRHILEPLHLDLGDQQELTIVSDPTQALPAKLDALKDILDDGERVRLGVNELTRSGDALYVIEQGGRAVPLTEQNFAPVVESARKIIEELRRQ